MNRRLFSLRFFPHPESRYQLPWNAVQVGFLLLPYSPLLGALSVLGAVIAIWSQNYRALVRQPITWGLGGLGFLLILSTLLAHDPAVAGVGLLHFLPLLFVFAALSHLIQAASQLRQLAWLWVVAAVPVILIGFGQLYGGWAGHPQILWVVLDLLVDPKGNPPGRMASIFSYATFLAHYLSIVTVVSLGLWLETLAKLRATLKFFPPQPRNWLKQGQVWQMVFLSGVLVGSAIALVLTNSRNAWGIALMSGVAFGLYVGWYWLLGVIGAIASTVFGAAFGPQPIQASLRHIVPTFFWARVNDDLYPNRPVAELRKTQWHFAADLIAQRPWTGWGLRNFSPLYEAQWHFWIGHPHNLYLMLAAETGIPTLLGFLGLVGWILSQGVGQLKRWRAEKDKRPDTLILFTYLVGFGACTLFSAFDMTLFDIRLNLMGWTLLAGIWGMSQRR